MVHNDLVYVQQLLAAGALVGPVLELGAGYGGDTCREVIERAGLEYVASDMHPGPGVDLVADFERGAPATDRRFGTVLVLNVLEHVFEPIAVARHAAELLAPAGRLVIITPTVWPLHHYPIDSQRLLPAWYDRFAERHGLVLLRPHFAFLPGGRVDDHRDETGYNYPPIARAPLRRRYTAAIAKLFNTASRGLTVPSHLAIACVMEKP